MKHSLVITLLCLVIPNVQRAETTDPPGHMKPLGSHSEPLGGIEEIRRFPSPGEFYENFVKKSKPLVMRKVLENGIIPAHHKWTDSFLRKVLGDEAVSVEARKANGKSEIGQMKMKEFIKKYKNLDGYLATETRTKLGLMQGDIYVPWTLHCGGFQKHIQTVFIYMSNGGNKSPLHSGDFDNINCFMDGSEDLFMADKKHRDLVHADHWIPSGGMSKVNPQKVDMYTFPKLQKLPWYNVTIHKGDCIFIPVNWFYQSNIASGRSLTLNYWFDHLFWHNKAECENIQDDALPINKFEMPENEDSVRLKIFESFEEAGREIVNFDELFSYLSMNNSKLTRNMVRKWFDELDQDGSGTLSWEEIQTSDIEKSIKKYSEIFSFLDNEQNESMQTKPMKQKEDEMKEKERDEDKKRNYENAKIGSDEL